MTTRSLDHFSELDPAPTGRVRGSGCAFGSTDSAPASQPAYRAIRPNDRGSSGSANGGPGPADHGKIPHRISRLVKVLRVLNRGSYGWSEYICSQPCATITELERFYEHAGILLCLLRLLGAKDCHCENLVAAGQFPVLIDTEALLHNNWRPWVEDGPHGEADLIASDLLDRSVLAVGFLPHRPQGTIGLFECYKQIQGGLPAWNTAS